MKFKVNKVEFRNQCDRFARAVGLSTKRVFRVEMALWAEDLAKRTGFVKRGSIRSVAAAHGAEPTLARAIQNDIAYAFQFTKGKTKKKTLAQAESYYQSKRDTRTGRPARIGDNPPTITAGDALRLARKLFRHAGTVRAGWVPMSRFFGGRMPASWITRNASRASGTAQDRMTAAGKGYMQGANRVPWIRRMCPPNMVQFTARVRDRHLLRMLRLETDKAVTAFNRLTAKRAA
jgi:hypothetical protein